MSEEYTTVKLSMPLIDDIELQRIDASYNDIVSEYTKAFVKEKEQVIIQRVMMNLQQENKQLKQENKILRENAEHNDKVVDKVNWENRLLKENIGRAINYIDQVIGYKPVAREIDEELNTLIGILRKEW